MLPAREWWTFVRLVNRRFREDACLAHATNLSFTTLLSLVPLMTVGIAALSAFPVFEKTIGQIQDFFFAHFTPKSASIEEVKQYIVSFSKKATQLSGVGIGFLILSALLLMYSIDQALNSIWRVKFARKPIIGFVVYWSVLTIGPLLVGISIASTSYLLAHPFFQQSETLSVAWRYFLLCLPILTTVFAFTLMYLIVPMRSVKLRHALVGAVLAAVLFELAKRGFTFYITTFPTYRFVYGALETIPIFMVWIYLSWIVVLIGAEVTHCLAIRHTEVNRDQRREMEWLFLLEMIRHLGDAHKRGLAFSTTELLNAVPALGEESLLDFLNEMQKSGIVQRTEAGKWVLSKDLREFTLFDLYKLRPSALPVGELATSNHLWIVYQDLIEALRANIQGVLAETAEELYLRLPLHR